MHRKPLILVLFCLFPLVVSSCISVERYVKLSSDGSGTEEIKMIFQKEFYSGVGSFAMMFDSTATEGDIRDSMYTATSELVSLKEQFQATEGITLIDAYSEIQPDSSNVINVKYSFDKVSRIGESMNKVNQDFESTPSKVSLIEEGDNLFFSYTYENAASGDSEDSLSAQMLQGLAGMFNTGRFLFELETPFEVISSNATSQSGNKLVWDMSISSIMTENKVHMEAVFKKD